MSTEIEYRDALVERLRQHQQNHELPRPVLDAIGEAAVWIGADEWHLRAITAEASLEKVAADTARPLPADVPHLAGLLTQWADVLDIPSGTFVNDDLRAAAAVLTALAERAETAERAAAAAQDREADTIHDLREAERRLAVATEVLRRIRDRRARVKTDWTHFAAAEEYLRMLDHDRTDARAALAQITGEARDE